ncbi:hypothetical protein [Streptomyces nigrescens]|uniref:hypothetical protein n=1 Tax=Streptomyces nigrescens TaxID=1920 RepID=UPI0036F79E88
MTQEPTIETPEKNKTGKITAIFPGPGTGPEAKSLQPWKANTPAPAPAQRAQVIVGAPKTLIPPTNEPTPEPPRTTDNNKIKKIIKAVTEKASAVKDTLAPPPGCACVEGQSCTCGCLIRGEHDPHPSCCPCCPYSVWEEDDADTDAEDDDDEEGEGGEDNGGGGRQAGWRRTQRPGTRRPAQRRRSAGWWAIVAIPVLRRFTLLNGTAAALGAYGYGLFTADWSTGLPQLVLGWMESAAADPTNAPSTPLWVGGFALVAFAVVGAAIAAHLPGARTLPAFAKVFHFLLIRVPAASAGLALVLYMKR